MSVQEGTAEVVIHVDEGAREACVHLLMGVAYRCVRRRIRCIYWLRVRSCWDVLSGGKHAAPRRRPDLAMPECRVGALPMVFCYEICDCLCREPRLLSTFQLGYLCRGAEVRGDEDVPVPCGEDSMAAE